MANNHRRLPLPGWVPPAPQIPPQHRKPQITQVQIPLYAPSPLPYWPQPDEPRRPTSDRGVIIHEPDGTSYRL